MDVRVRIVVLFLAAGLLPAMADDMAPGSPQAPATQAPGKSTPDKSRSIDPKEQRTLEGFGAQNKTCLEWSDGCAVCVRQEGDKFACSLPGIACEPSGLACRREGKSGPQPKPSGK